jgi:hypothetical protein
MCFAYVTAASSEATAAVVTSNGGHGLAVDAEADDARQISSVKNVFLMPSRI